VRVVALLALALLSGCGSGGSRQVQPAPPRLPRALAQAWAQQADGVASALAAGDRCTARSRAVALQRRVIAAVNAHRVPRRLLEPLSSGVNELAGRIACVPAPVSRETPVPTDGPGKGHGRKHDRGPDHGHDHGHGHGKGGGG
jgi:hypothetical protein